MNAARWGFVDGGKKIWFRFTSNLTICDVDSPYDLNSIVFNRVLLNYYSFNATLKFKFYQNGKFLLGIPNSDGAFNMFTASLERPYNFIDFAKHRYINGLVKYVIQTGLPNSNYFKLRDLKFDTSGKNMFVLYNIKRTNANSYFIGLQTRQMVNPFEIDVSVPWVGKDSKNLYYNSTDKTYTEVILPYEKGRTQNNGYDQLHVNPNGDLHVFDSNNRIMHTFKKI